MKTPAKKLSYIIQVALSATKSGPDEKDVAWFRKELKDWFYNCFDVECLKIQK